MQMDLNTILGLNFFIVHNITPIEGHIRNRDKAQNPKKAPFWTYIRAYISKPNAQTVRWSTEIISLSKHSEYTTC